MAETDHILILVTDQASSERLIKAGSLLRNLDYPDYGLRVLSVQPRSRMGNNAPALQYLFNISRDVDAEMVVLFSDDPVSAAMDYIIKCGAGHVVHGQGPSGRSEFMEQLRDELDNVHFMEVPYPIMQSDALLHYTA